MTSPDDLIALEGGGRSVVHRRGDVVIRDAGPWTPAVHALLRHLEQTGFAAAPRLVGSGLDPDGREVLTFIDGQFTQPGPWSLDGAAAVGGLLRDLHQAIASFRPPPDAVWFPWHGRDLGSPAKVGRAPLRVRADPPPNVSTPSPRRPHRFARRDAQRIGEHCGQCLADELAPRSQPARPGRDTELTENADEPAVTAVFAGELPGKQPRRGRVGGRGHVGTVGKVLPQQGGHGLGHVEPVRTELEPGGVASAGGVGRTQRGDCADLLAIERDEAAGDPVTGWEGLVE